MSAKINDSGRPATSTLEPSFDQPRLNWIANYIWGIADDVLRDLYLRGKYRDVILPMTVVRRQCEPHWACANSLPFVAAGQKASGPMDDRGQSERRCREDTGGSWGGLPGHEEAAAAASAARSARHAERVGRPDAIKPSRMTSADVEGIRPPARPSTNGPRHDTAAPGAGAGCGEPGRDCASGTDRRALRRGGNRPANDEPQPIGGSPCPSRRRLRGQCPFVLNPG